MRICLNTLMEKSKANYGKAIAKVYAYSAVKPESYLSLQTKNHDCGAEIKHFVEKIGK